MLCDLQDSHCYYMTELRYNSSGLFDFNKHFLWVRWMQIFMECVQEKRKQRNLLESTCVFLKKVISGKVIIFNIFVWNLEEILNGTSMSLKMLIKKKNSNEIIYSKQLYQICFIQQAFFYILELQQQTAWTKCLA